MRGLQSIEECEEKGQMEAAQSEKEEVVSTTPPPPHLEEEEEEEAPSEPKTPPLTSAAASASKAARTSTGAHMKQVTFQPHETPLMFSRASSFESLNSFDQHSIR